MSLGEGAVISKSIRQKQNGRSSTDNEVYAVDDMMGQILHTLYFMEAQGYHIKHNILMQDNHSTIRLEKNGVGLAWKKIKTPECKILLHA